MFIFKLLYNAGEAQRAYYVIHNLATRWHCLTLKKERNREMLKYKKNSNRFGKIQKIQPLFTLITNKYFSILKSCLLLHFSDFFLFCRTEMFQMFKHILGSEKDNLRNCKLHLRNDYFRLIHLLRMEELLNLAQCGKN